MNSSSYQVTKAVFCFFKALFFLDVNVNNKFYQGYTNNHTIVTPLNYLLKETHRVSKQFHDLNKVNGQSIPIFKNHCWIKLEAFAATALSFSNFLLSYPFHFQPPHFIFPFHQFIYQVPNHFLQSFPCFSRNLIKICAILLCKL